MSKATAKGPDRALATLARELHNRALVIDLEGVIVLLPGVHLPPSSRDGLSFVERALRAGLTALNTTLGQGPIVSGVDDLRGLLNSIYGHLVYFDLHPDTLLLVSSAEDLRRAKRDGKLGVIFGVQGIGPKIEGDLTLLRILHKLGLRIASLTQNDSSALGSGCLNPANGGLTQFGGACLREMNCVGILSDLAHAGERTALDALELSSAPCIISHANVRALADHPRNVSDQVLKALAIGGGVIGLTAYAPFIRDQREGRPTLEHLVNQICYIANLVGEDHVGIGSDHFEFELEVRYADFACWFPDSQRGYPLAEVNIIGFESVDDWPSLTEALFRRGLSETAILKILGENHLRVMKAAWGG